MSSHTRTDRPRLPPLKALLAFEAASRLGSFTRGAQELAVTTSAVSHQIQQLEEFLGVKLFHRHPGRVELTAAGQTYTSELERAFELIANATTLIAPQSQKGTLVIASGPSFASKWLQPRLPDFMASHPGIRIRLTTSTTWDDPTAERFDIGISYGRPASAAYAAEPLVVERLKPLCSPALVAQLGLERPQDLQRATLIHSSNALSWSQYFRRIGLFDLQFSNELWLDRSAMAIDAAVAGQGVALESEILAAQELQDGRLVAPFGFEEFAVELPSYFLVMGERSSNGAQVRAFETWLKGALGR